MAVWQFKFSLLPRKEILRLHGVLPKFLTQYRESESPDYLYAENDEFLNYWENHKPAADIVKQVSSLLPPRESWSKDALMFGIISENQIEIWIDDFDCAIDLRDFSLPLLEGILALAVQMDCVVAVTNTGELVEPDLNEILRRIANSRAFEFCKAPSQYLERLVEPKRP